MIISTSNATKATSIATTIPAVAFTFDLTWITLIALGLFMGWLARVARLVHENQGWTTIRKDILVSLLIGGANGLLAAIIISYFSLTYMQGVGVAFVVAFAGLKTLDSITRSVLKKLGELGSQSGDKMIVEKRGYRKEYDANGKLISKVAIGNSIPTPVENHIDEETDIEADTLRDE